MERRADHSLTLPQIGANARSAIELKNALLLIVVRRGEVGKVQASEGSEDRMNSSFELYRTSPTPLTTTMSAACTSCIAGLNVSVRRWRSDEEREEHVSKELRGETNKVQARFYLYFLKILRTNQETLKHLKKQI